MASNASPVQTSATHLVQGSQASIVAPVQQEGGGKSLPLNGKADAVPVAASNSKGTLTTSGGPGDPSGSAKTPSGGSSKSVDTAAQSATQTRGTAVETLVAHLNKTLNDSGRPDQFRVDPESANTIQEVNPANGDVIGQFSADEFPALARSVGATGLLIDSLA